MTSTWVCADCGTHGTAGDPVAAFKALSAHHTRCPGDQDRAPLGQPLEKRPPWIPPTWRQEEDG